MGASKGKIMATRGETYEKCGVVSLKTEDEANEELSEEDGVLLENILKKAFQSYLDYSGYDDETE